MKERIILDFGAELKNICDGCAEGVKAKCKQKQKDHLQCALQMSELEDFKVEKYPTSWEELKELCKKENISKCEDEIKVKWHNNTSLYFYEKDGEIICKDEDSCIEMIIGYDRTPAQMWQVIKNL